MSFLIMVAFYAQNVLANPTGGQVAVGNATISNQSANTVQINQTSNKAIINWHSFNIAPNEKTQFQQPSASSITLNRIDPSHGASQIFGQITANGRIIIVNQAGIYFGPTARVDVGGIIASTSDISNENFMSGKYIFDQSSGYLGSVINKGTISAGRAGLVALLGTTVQNDGLIRVNVGSVILASGSKFTLDFTGDGLINFAVDASATSLGVDQNGKPLKHAISNSGKIIANGGEIIMRARDVKGVLRSAINMSGVLIANSVQEKNGVIILSTDNGTTKVTGKIYARGKHRNGGEIQVLGKQVVLAKNAVIDASGETGGGEILIGGDYHGGNSQILNAQNTYVGKNVSIKANALNSGNGGKIIVWSDNTTKFFGSASANGGILNGNGGFIETSGKNYLDISGSHVNANAPMGNAGTWLLDPRNVAINTSTTTCTTAPCFSSGDPSIYTPDTNSSSVNVNDILNALEAGTSVTITTGNDGTQTGTIAVNTAINKTTGSTPVTLSLDSSNGGGTITISNPITADGSSGPLGIILNSGNAITINGNITTNGGNFLSTSQNATNISANKTISTGTGSVTINANASAVGGQDFVMTATSTITTTGSPVTINVNGAGGGTGQATLGNISTAGGALTVATDTGNNTTGSAIVQAGAVGTSYLSVGDANFSTGNGAITLTHTNNNFTGAASLTSDTSSNNIALTDVNDLTLGAINMPNGSGTLTINSTGAITQNGSTIITSGTGLSNFNSGTTGAPITLTNNNVFNGAVALNNVGTNDVSINNVGNLLLDVINVGNNLNVITSNGNISQNGTKVITVSGTANFIATGTGDSITITNNNEFTGAVSISNQGINDVSIKNTLPLIFGTTSVGNNLTVTTTGTGSNISQSGSTTLTIPGTSSFTVAGSSINLGNNNSLSGSVSLTNSGANDVTLVTTGALQLDTSTIGGNLTLTAGGNISQMGAITASGGTTSLSVTTQDSDISLATQSNNLSSISFTGALSNIHDVSIQDSNTSISTPDFSGMSNLHNLTLYFSGTHIILDTTTLHNGGNLSLTAKGITGGAINQIGPLIVPGTTTLSATTGTSSLRSIILTDSGNQFIGNVSVDNSGASAAASITNSLALKLGSINIGSGALNLNGAGISQPGGAITQSSGSGAVTLTANTGSVDLSNSSNSILGAVTITNSTANPVTLNNSNALTLANITLTGSSNLTLTALSLSQQASTSITANTLSTTTTENTTLANTNSISNLGTISAGGAFSINNSGTLNITGSISADTTSNPLSISTSGLLTINNSISSNSGTNGISLTGLGITQNTSTVNAGSGALTINANTGTLTLNSGANLFTNNKATLTADSMTFDTSATPAQIGGTGLASGFASQVVLQPSTISTTIGIAGASGNLSLTQLALNDVRATNVRIGNSSGIGAISIGAWSPASNFANNGVLSFVTTGSISESGAIDLSNTGASLLLRNASAVTLTNTNVFNNIAANTAGALSITNASMNPLTVTSLTDDINTVSGITAPDGVTLSTSGTGASITINQNISTTNHAIALTGYGITQADNTTINAGTNNITLNAGSNSLTTGTNSLLYSRGIVALTANTMNLNGVQIGGSATATQTATNVIFTGSSGTSIGIAGGSGTLLLSSSALDTVKSTNVRIGDSNAGAINIGSWTPAATFAKNGVLTLDTASTIIQSGSINLLANSVSSLILRDASSVTLTDTGNVFSTIAANIAGSLSLTNSSGNQLTIDNLTDDIGSVSGITSPSGATLTVAGTSGLLKFNNGGVTTTNNPILLTATGVTITSNNTISSGSGNITVNGETGNITTNNNAPILSTGIITLTADNMAFSTSASSQIGGSGIGSGSAQTVILDPYTSGTTMGVAGASGSYTFTVSQAQLNNIHATNVRIGSDSAGPMTINSGSAWKPHSNFANGGTLTFDSGSSITQGGGIDLSLNTANLLVRDATSVDLSNSNNILNNIAANISGPITIVNKSTNPLTVSSLTDDLGSVSGITSTGAVILTTSGIGGSLSINQNITSGNNAISLTGVGITQANSSIINAGSGTISIDGGSSTLQFNSGTLTTTNNTSSALQMIDATTVALGNINVSSGTFTLGDGTITNAVSQNSGTSITTNNLIADTTNSINLSNSNNMIGSIGSITRGGALTINDNQDLTISGPITAGTISNPVLINTSGVLSLNGNISTNGNNNITLVGSEFINNTGASALNPGSGEYLIWSSNPANDTRGGLAYNFKQYNAIYGVTSVLGTGNGFLYSISPSVTASLVNSVSKVYDGTTVATLANNNYSVSGAIDGDSVTLNNPTSGTYNNKNVGTNIPITVSGITITSATDGTATVYGYQLTSSTAQGNIGAITAAPITVTAQSDTRVYNGTTNSTISPVIAGTIYSGDSISTLPIQTFDNKNVGINKLLTPSGLVISDGNNGNNYHITYDTNNNGIITAAALTVTAQSDNRVYNATANSNVTPIISGTIYGSDSISAYPTQVFDIKNVGTGKILTASGLAMNDGNNGNNYAISYVTNNSGMITPAPLTISNVTADNKVYDATASATINTSSASLSGVYTGDVVNLNTNTATGSFDNKNAGNNKLVTTMNFSINGNDSGNYTLSQPTTIATIFPASLTTQGITANNKLFDGTAQATLNVSNGSLNGILGSDQGQVALQSGAGLFATFSPGINIPVTVTSITLSGSEASNYVVVFPSGLTADIQESIPTHFIPQNTFSYLYSLSEDWLNLNNNNLNLQEINFVDILKELDNGNKNCASLGSSITICKGS